MQYEQRDIRRDQARQLICCGSIHSICVRASKPGLVDKDHKEYQRLPKCVSVLDVSPMAGGQGFGSRLHLRKAFLTRHEVHPGTDRITWKRKSPHLSTHRWDSISLICGA